MNGWAEETNIRTYTGDSDASAAVAVDDRYFAVGDDEHNILRVYSIGGLFAPVFSVDVGDFLKADPKHPEADIEAAARIGQRIYWMTSHGRNTDGKIQLTRYRFFATDIKTADPNQPPRIVPVGRPYGNLVPDMLKTPGLNKLNLKSVTRLDELLSKQERQQLAPKEKGLNIEGLAVGPDGHSLWIGLRNPLYDDGTEKRKAIVIPLLNPDEVIEQAKPARFGEVILLDLGGRGIRSIDFVQSRKEYWITAGSTGSRSQVGFAVFRYCHSDRKLIPMEVHFPKDFTPESMVAFSDPATVWFISDDGTIEREIQSPLECMSGQLLENGRCPNKYICDPNKRVFRVFQFNLRP
jgi:hypothetical protein